MRILNGEEKPMIKIERKETEKTKQAIADLQKASENESSYNIESVNQALKEIIYVFLTIFLYLLKCPQSLILSALRAFCLCGKPHISRLIFLYFPCQSWLKSW